MTGILFITSSNIVTYKKNTDIDIFAPLFETESCWNISQSAPQLHSTYSNSKPFLCRPNMLL